MTSHRGWSSHIIDTTFDVHDGPAGLYRALQKICDEAGEKSLCHQILVLSDRRAGKERVPISSLLVLGIYLVITLINKWDYL